MRAVGALFATLITLGGLIYGSFALYEGSWDLAQHNENHQSELILNGFNYQSMLGQQITKGIDNVTTDSTDITSAQMQHMTAYADQLKAQRENDGNTVCTQAIQINGSLPQGVYQTTWINANCANGSISPSSAYYYVGE